jgi:hypothetical protein
VRGDTLSAVVPTVLFEAIVLDTAVAENTVPREMRAVEDVLHQVMLVDKVQLAASKWTCPVRAVLGKLAVENEEIKGNDCKDSGLGAAVNLGGNHVNSVAVRNCL